MREARQDCVGAGKQVSESADSRQQADSLRKAQPRWPSDRSRRSAPQRTMTAEQNCRWVALLGHTRKLLL